jgi:DNA-binding MarR family transcriptional regulator
VDDEGGREVDTAEARGVSHHLFGNSYLLEVAAAVHEAETPRVTRKALVGATGLDKGLVSTAVAKLVKAGLLDAMESDGREKPLSRRPSGFWRLAADLRAELRTA